MISHSSVADSAPVISTRALYDWELGRHADADSDGNEFQGRRAGRLHADGVNSRYFRNVKSRNWDFPGSLKAPRAARGSTLDCVADDAGRRSYQDQVLPRDRLRGWCTRAGKPTTILAQATTFIVGARVARSATSRRIKWGATAASYGIVIGNGTEIVYLQQPVYPGSTWSGPRERDGTYYLFGQYPAIICRSTDPSDRHSHRARATTGDLSSE